MDSYTTIPLYCPIHDNPERPFLASPQELTDAGGYIACDTCGEPMRPLRPFYIVEHPTTHELHMFAANPRCLYRLDGTPIEAPEHVARWPIFGAVAHLYDWQDNSQAEHLRRYIVASLSHPDPNKTFLAGGQALSIRNWANDHGYIVVSPRSFATRQDARIFAFDHNGIAW